MRRASIISLICVWLSAPAVAQERPSRPDAPSRPQSERSSITRFGAASDSTAPLDFEIYHARNPVSDLANTFNLLFRDRKDVVVVPELGSNSLLIRSTPETRRRLLEVLSQLDQTPKTVRFEIYLLDLQMAVSHPVAPAGDQAPKNPPASAELKGPAEKVFATIEDWQQQGRTKVLNHFEIAAIDNNPSKIQLGARKPRVTGTQPVFGRGGQGGNQGFANSITMENVGTLMSINSRVNSEGAIVAQVDFEKTFLGADEEGKVIAEVEGRDKVYVPPSTTLSIKQTIQLTSGSAQPIAAAAGTSEPTEPGRFLLVVAAKIDDAK